MKKYPIEKQVEAKDCGVCCLSMIIKYYQGYLPKDDLRDMTKTSRNGTTAYHLVETLKEIGFNAYGIRCDLQDFQVDNIILPCIANVIIDNSYKHFIVIYEINYRKKYLIIGDPADRLKRMKFIDFEKIYNNVLIISQPNKTIPIINDHDYTFLLNLFNRHKKIIIYLVFWSIILTILATMSAFFVECVLKSISIESNNYLIFIFIIFFSINVCKTIIDYIRNRLVIRINQRIDLDMTLEVFEKIVKLPYRFYRNRTTGDIISRISDLGIVRDMITKVALSIFIDLPLTILVLILMFLINHTLFIISIVMMIIDILIVLLFKRSYQIKIKGVQRAKAEANSFMVETISGFETVKGIHIENDILRKFKFKYYNFINSVVKLQKNFFFQHALKESVSEIGFVVIMLIGAILVMKSQMRLGSLFTFTTLLTFFLNPIRNIIDLDSSIQEVKSSIKRIVEIMNKETKDGILNVDIKGNVCFNNLTYTFNDRDIILNKIDLTIAKSKKVMIIGKSGSGKSTLFKLLMKYYKVDNNKLLIDSVDINNLSINAIKKDILYISQNEVLFNDTIYNNITMNDKNDSQFLKVTKMCHIDEIASSDLGYNMIVEENGFNISGGERQRIVLARTLMKDFKILIIDEGLNQVDINLERQILKELFKEYSSKTIIVISHRLDNLDLFDQLVELSQGTIIRNVEKKGTDKFNRLTKDNNLIEVTKERMI